MHDSNLILHHSWEPVHVHYGLFCMVCSLLLGDCKYE